MKFKVGEKYEVMEKGEKGNIIEITEVHGDHRRYKTIKGTGDLIHHFHVKSCFARMLKPLKNECIVIYRNGAETVALDKSTGKKAVAKCSPADEYDFYFGANVALGRLLIGATEPEVREVKRRAKVGEYVKIVAAYNPKRHKDKPEYKNGDILKIAEVNMVAGVKYGKELGQYLYDNEYVVLEGYQPPQEEKQPEFKPHLLWRMNKYGYIGEETPLKDAIGRALRIGDTVELYDENNKFCGERVVCKICGKAFVCGIEAACEKNGNILLGWKVILKRKYEDIADGEVVDEIKYIKEV